MWWLLIARSSVATIWTVPIEWSVSSLIRVMVKCLSKSETFYILATWAAVRTVIGCPARCSSLMSWRPSLNILYHSKTPASLFNELKGLRRGIPEFKAKFHIVALLDGALHAGATLPQKVTKIDLLSQSTHVEGRAWKVLECRWGKYWMLWWCAAIL